MFFISFNALESHLAEHDDYCGPCDSSTVDPDPPDTTSAGLCIDTVSCGSKDDKIQICHVPPGNPSQEHEICISFSALDTHLNEHDDYCGPCDSSSSKTSFKRMSIYPNPASGSIMVVNPEGILAIQIIDTYGQIHWDSKYSGEETYAEINLNKYAKGIYFIRVVGEILTTTEKLIIQQ